MWYGSKAYNVSEWSQVGGLYQKLLKDLQRQEIGNELLFVRKKHQVQAP